MTVDEAALVLADHYAFAAYGYQTAAPTRCACGWIGPASDHPTHLAEALDRAGLLADGTPPETPTTRVLTERADRRTT